MASTTERTAPAAPAGGPSLDGVLAAGEELRREISERTRERRERYLELAGELRVVGLYEHLRRSLPDGLTPEALADGGGASAELARRVVAARDALKGLMREYVRLVERALDPEECRLWNAEFDIQFAPGSNRRAKAFVEGAAMWFPLAWMARSNAAGPLKITVGRRGEYESESAEGYPEGASCVPLARARLRIERDAPFSSAVHELAHRAQDTVCEKAGSPGLAALEGLLYRRRTFGSSARRRDGCRHDERFREADPPFFSYYAGKDPRLSYDVPCDAWEIFPTGLEAMVGQELDAFEEWVCFGDAEHEAFVLGCLAVL